MAKGWEDRISLQLYSSYTLFATSLVPTIKHIPDVIFLSLRTYPEQTTYILLFLTISVIVLDSFIHPFILYCTVLYCIVLYYISAAKILIPGGSGDDIECGVPIMVTVEEADDVAAFANFVAEAPPVAAAAAAEPVAEPEPVVAATPAPPPTPVVAVAAAVPIPVEVSPPAMEVMAEIVAPVLSIGWGEFAKINSPILKTLSRQQNDYIEKYGTTGQVPL